MKPTSQLDPRSRSCRLTISELLLFSIIIAAWGCARFAQKTQERPDWLAEDAARVDQEFFYGVGCAQYQIDNHFFKRDTARERARVDLAHVVYDQALAELNGDTSASRAVVETVLPARKLTAQYQDQQGNLCVRARLPRAVVDQAIQDHNQ